MSKPPLLDMDWERIQLGYPPKTCINISREEMVAYGLARKGEGEVTIERLGIHTGSCGCPVDPP